MPEGKKKVGTEGDITFFACLWLELGSMYRRQQADNQVKESRLGQVSPQAAVTLFLLLGLTIKAQA